MLGRAIGADAADARAAARDRFGAGRASRARRAPECPQRGDYRVAGALAQSDYGGISSESIGDRKVDYTSQPAGGWNAFRRSGAMGLLSPWRVRRLGTKPTAPAPAPRRGDLFRWAADDALAVNKPETRAAAPYSDAIVSAILARASGGQSPNVGATAAVEAASSLMGRAFASAQLTPPVEAVSPPCSAWWGER